ncbi:MAG: RimK family alpha-L-glutamate ligase [Ktedonobacteraceae bacterium]
MRFCFIIEAQYKNESMPLVIADQLLHWGHEVALLEPDKTFISLTDLTKQDYDAYVLKTVSDGSGLSILEAAEAVGIPTINNSRSIRLVRDKAIAIVVVHAHGLPVPRTYFIAHPYLLKQIPEKDYPLVVKPTNGSSCRGIYRVDSPASLPTLEIAEANDSFFLAQSYVENTGFDIKLYVVGTEVYAVAKRSPLHPEVEVDKQPIPLTLELRKLALDVGKIFGLDIYGLDVVETSHGPVVVDINDFPSYGQVPRAVELVASHILHVATRTKLQRAVDAKHPQPRYKTVSLGNTSTPIHLTNCIAI